MRGKYISHDFYCLNCGKKNAPIYRNRGRGREKDHRKRLYCPWCKQEVNHIECKNEQEVEEFRRAFEAGEFAEEAEASKLYIQERLLDFNV